MAPASRAPRFRTAWIAAALWLPGQLSHAGAPGEATLAPTPVHDAGAAPAPDDEQAACPRCDATEGAHTHTHAHGSVTVEGTVVVAVRTPRAQADTRPRFSGWICRLRTEPGDLFRRLEVIGAGRAIPAGTSLSARLLLDLGPSGLLAAYDPIAPGLHLLEAQLTWALIDSEDGRLRLTGGVGSLLAPGGGRLGARAGLSATWRLAGAVFADGQLAITPYPFVGFDARGGVALEMVFVRLEAGLRTTLLWSGPVSATALGPYLAAGLVF